MADSSIHGPPPLTPRALRTRGALARLLDPRRRDDHAGPAVRAMGLVFPGPVGLAAGFDRHGRLAGRAAQLGFGAVEIGTVVAGTRPPSGLAAIRPRDPHRSPCGMSLGKRPGTPWNRAELDYASALLALHPRADYVTLNPGRDRPPAERFVALVAALAPLRDRLAHRRRRALPLVVKLPAPWLAGEDRVRVASAFVAAGADGLLVSAEGAGSRSTARAILAEIARGVGRDTLLISVGGVDSVREALARVRAGAHLVQIHRAAGTHDARLVGRINRALASR